MLAPGKAPALLLRAPAAMPVRTLSRAREAHPANSIITNRPGRGYRVETIENPGRPIHPPRSETLVLIPRPRSRAAGTRRRLHDGYSRRLAQPSEDALRHLVSILSRDLP